MKKNGVSIIIVVIVCCSIFGVWKLKHNQKQKELLDNQQVSNKDFVFQVTEKIDLERLKSYHLPMILDFGSEGCPPCRAMKPDLKKVHEDTLGRAIVRYSDVWESQELAEGYPMEYIPTQMLFNSDGTPFKPENAKKLDLEFLTDSNGNHILTRHVGILTYEQMMSMLKEMGLDG